MSKPKRPSFNRIANELNDAELILGKVKYTKQMTSNVENLQNEIGKILKQHSAIQEALVVIDDKHEFSTDARLSVYVVARPKYSPVISGRQRYKLPNNMAIVHQNEYETTATYKEVFEDQIYLKHGIVLGDNACVFDVGANIGLFTLFIQQICKNPSIYAFEPAPPIFELLRLNTIFYKGNVKLFNYGLSNESKSATFTFYPRASEASGYYPDLEQDAAVGRVIVLNQYQNSSPEQLAAMNKRFDELVKEMHKGEVFTSQLRPLSDILKEYEIACIDLLKIDVERSELDVLHGIDQENWCKIKQIVLEVHDDGGRLERVKALLNKQGFKVAVDQEPLFKNTGIYNVYATQESLNNKEGNEGQISSHPRRLPNLVDHRLSSNELQRFVREKLPAQTAFLDFIFLDAIPRTNDAEVDFQALPKPIFSAFGLENSKIAPRTSTEKVLSEIVMELLGISQLSIYDDFFALGGDSLLAVQLLSRVREVFYVELPIRLLFDDSFTVAALARTIENCQIEQADADELRAVLDELSELSEDEVQALVAESEKDLLESVQE